jgi:hypothetical protein
MLPINRVQRTFQNHLIPAGSLTRVCMLPVPRILQALGPIVAQSVDVEEKLYREASKLDIACITLSQRLALPQFHRQELRMGANTADGYEIHEITNDAAPARGSRA